MRRRAPWRPPAYCWVLVGLAALLLVHRVSPQHLQGRWLAIMPLAIVLAVLCLRALWERPPAIGLCATLVLTIFSSNWGQIGLGGLPLNRLLAVFVLAQFALNAPGVANLPRPQVRNVHLLMALLVLYAIGSAAAAGTLGLRESIFSLADVLGAIPFLLFLVAPAVFSGRRERNLLLGTLVGLGAYLGLTALFESLGPHSLVYPRYIVGVDASEGVRGVGGPFGSRVAEGFAAFACAAAALMAAAQWQAPRQRWLALSVAALCAFACFATLERGIWIAAVGAAALTALATRRGRRLLLPGAMVCAIGIGGTLMLSSTLAQKTSERAGYELSVWNRENQTAAGLRMVAAKPLFGFGWDRYRDESREYFRQPADFPLNGYVPVVTIGLPEEVLPLHDTYLAYATELGLLGTLLWVVAVGWAVIEALSASGPAALRPWKLSLLALAVFFLIINFFNPHEQPFPILLLLVWAGVARGVAVPEPAPRRSLPASPTGRLAAARG